MPRPRLIAEFKHICDEDLAFWRKEVGSDAFFLRHPEEPVHLARQIRGWMHGARQMAYRLVPKTRRGDREADALDRVLNEAAERLMRDASLAAEWVRVAKEVHDEF